MLIRIEIIILAFILLGGLGFFFTRNAQSPTPANQIPSPTAIATVEPTVIDSLQAGGSSYSDPDGVYVFLYPNDYRLDLQNTTEGTRIYKTGATQQGQTEIYDGVIVEFESATRNNQSLEQWTDNRIKQLTTDGTISITKPKKATKIKSYTGFTFETESLGNATYLILQKDPASQNVVVITYSVNDPQKQGYQKDVDSILASLELLK